MRYCGSKKKYAKYLIPIITEHLSKDVPFIDAFMGGANILSEVKHDYKIGIELNKYVIALWKELSTNGMFNIPINVSKELYDDVKTDYINNTQKYADYIIGYVGTCCSYGGAWFNGYAKFNPNKNEDHIKEAYNGLRKQLYAFKNLKETHFINCSYTDIENFLLPKGTVIYCDPPYANTKKYMSDFDNQAFWKWCRKMSKKGYYVYISEYEAPDDFRCIWHMVKKDGMATTKKGEKQNIKIEKLFVYNED